MAAGVLGNALQMLRPGQRFEHADGGDDVVVDRLAFGGIERPGADGEVFQLVGGKEVLFRAAAIAPAVASGNAPHPLLLLRLHRFAADVDAAQEALVVLDLLQTRLQRLPGLIPPGALAHGAPHGQFGVAAQHLEARVDQGNAVENGLQLGRLVDHMHRRRHLAAIVQQAGDLQLVAFLVVEGEAGQRPIPRCRHGFGQHHGKHRYALAMAAGIGRLFVDGQVDHADEGFEQGFQLIDQQAVGQRHGRLRGERFGQAQVGIGKLAHHAALCVDGVDQLKNADHFVLVVLQRHGEKRLRPVAGHFVEAPRAGKIETLLAIGVGDIDRAGVNRRIGGDERIVRLPVGVIERQVLELRRNRRARRAAVSDVERIGVHDLEAQAALIVADPVQGAAVGVRDRLRREQDVLQQAVDIALVGERGANRVELLEALEQIVQGIHALSRLI